MKNLTSVGTILFPLLLYGALSGQDIPSPTGEGAGIFPSVTQSVLYDQMDNPGGSDIISSSYYSPDDIYTSFAADDFAFMDAVWSVGSVEVSGTYNSPLDTATSVNVWIYSSDGSGGLPQDTIYNATNIIPSNGLADGSFMINLPVPAILTEGWYWLCVQANMRPGSAIQWGWTGRTVQSFSESAWKNPGGGFGNPCTSWGYRVTDCGYGSDPDNCFRLLGDIVPVELTSFTETSNSLEVQLNWSTATELNNKGFEIERSTNQNDFVTIRFVNGHGTTTEQHDYSFTDRHLTNAEYYYRLKQIDYDGTFEYSDIVKIEITVPNEFSLEQNYPNPFNPSTKIRYSIPLPSNVTIKVFDMLGKEIETVVNEEKPVGTYEINWYSKHLPSGVYFYQLRAGSFVETKKMVLMK
jgi:hypothetical protein